MYSTLYSTLYSSMARRLVCVAVLLAVLIAANAPDDRGGAFFYRILAPLGMDVAMTPVTADMQLMLGKFDHQDRYLRSISFLVSVVNPKAEGLAKSMIELSVDHLDLYRFRVPFLLMSEIAGGGGDTRLHERALCRELSLKLGRSSIDSFQVSLQPPMAGDFRIGLNRPFNCQPWSNGTLTNSLEPQ